MRNKLSKSFTATSLSKVIKVVKQVKRMVVLMVEDEDVLAITLIEVMVAITKIMEYLEAMTRKNQILVFNKIQKVVVVDMDMDMAKEGMTNPILSVILAINVVIIQVNTNIRIILRRLIMHKKMMTIGLNAIMDGES